MTSSFAVHPASHYGGDSFGFRRAEWCFSATAAFAGKTRISARGVGTENGVTVSEAATTCTAPSGD